MSEQYKSVLYTFTSNGELGPAFHLLAFNLPEQLQGLGDDLFELLAPSHTEDFGKGIEDPALKPWLDDIRSQIAANFERGATPSNWHLFSATVAEDHFRVWEGNRVGHFEQTVNLNNNYPKVELYGYAAPTTESLS